MSSGTRLVLVFLVGALVALLAFLSYGRRAAGEREPGPLEAASERVRSDNTVVGRLGGFRALDPLRMEPIEPDGFGLAARLVGVRDSARLYADLVRENGRWRLARGAVVLPDGRRLPIEGRGRPTLEPLAER